MKKAERRSEATQFAKLRAWIAHPFQGKYPSVIKVPNCTMEFNTTTGVISIIKDSKVLLRITSVHHSYLGTSTLELSARKRSARNEDE